MTENDLIPKILSPSISGISYNIKTNYTKKTSSYPILVELMLHFELIIISIFLYTLNKAITTEKKLINAVAKIRGLVNMTGLPNTWVCHKSFW